LRQPGIALGFGQGRSLLKTFDGFVHFPYAGQGTAKKLIDGGDTSVLRHLRASASRRYPWKYFSRSEAVSPKSPAAFRPGGGTGVK